MALKFVAPLAVLAVVLADQSSHVSFTLGETPAHSSHTSHSHPHPPTHPPSHPPSHPHTHGYTPAPYHPTRPTYGPRPSYKPEPDYEPSYGHEPHYPPRPTYPPTPYHPKPHYRPHSTTPYGHDAPPPSCAESNPTKPWCLEDKEYPTYEIKHALEEHLDKVLTLYADVADLDTAASVYRPRILEEETYLCPSDTSYVRPLRAVNTEGKWRIIVNNIKAHYTELTQTTRIEECLTYGDACPLVPLCYESKCLQKSIYHRFLVYDPYDQYFPFAIETFKLPASCACLLGAYYIDH